MNKQCTFPEFTFVVYIGTVYLAYMTPLPRGTEFSRGSLETSVQSFTDGRDTRREFCSIILLQKLFLFLCFSGLTMKKWIVLLGGAMFCVLFLSMYLVVDQLGRLPTSQEIFKVEVNS